MNNIINIAFISDDGYVLPTSVAITSLIKNKLSSTIYKINIVTADLKENSIEIFKSLSSDSVIINIISASAEKFKGMHRNSGNSYCVATEAALLKFELPNLIDDTEKLLYLDGDIIVKSDLSELYNVDIEEKYAAVVQDSGIMYTNDTNKNRFKEYFNSGVMLLNLALMRQDNLSEILIEAKRKSTDMSLMDQNIFNLVFENKVKTLNTKYNLLYINLLRAKKQNKFTINDLNNLYDTNYLELEEIKDDAVILHYSSKDKPWKCYNVPTVEMWDEYYKLSPMGFVELKRTKVRKEKESKNLFQKFFFTLKREGVKAVIKKTYGFLKKHKKSKVLIVPYSIFKIIKSMYRKSVSFSYLLPKYNGLNKTEKRDKEIIVSLTTIPSRIDAVCIVIGTMLRQTVKPDKIQLYLGQDEFKDIKLPLWLKLQMRCGVEVIYCKDLKPHTKYFYAMKNNKGSIVITVDDDILYHNDTIEILYKSYLKHPEAVSALRTHLITFNGEGILNPYNVWRQRWSRLIDVPTIKLFATGVGGVLYPPDTMNEDLLKEDIFMKLCPIGDDLWLKVMQLLNDIPCVLAAKQRTLRYIDGTQEIALHKTNVGQGKNDEQLNNLFEFYNDYYGEDDKLLDRIKNDATPIRNS